MPIPIPIAAGTFLLGLIGIGLLGSGASKPVPTTRELEAALHQVRQEKKDGYGATTPPAYEMFLVMEPADVPDDLLVAVLLAGSTRGRSAVDVARELLTDAGGLPGLVSGGSFRRVQGVGQAGQARIKAATELGRRLEYRRALERRHTITTPAAAARLFETMLVGPYEKLGGLYLDRRRRVIGTRVLTVGSDAFTIVDPKQILRPAIELGASAVVLGHHHPSGDPRPSSQDIDVTRRVESAGRVLGIPLLDHVVLGGEGRFTSLAEEGHISGGGAMLPLTTAR